jgi:hypothetical protein
LRRKIFDGIEKSQLGIQQSAKAKIKLILYIDGHHSLALNHTDVNIPAQRKFQKEKKKKKKKGGLTDKPPSFLCIELPLPAKRRLVHEQGPTPQQSRKSEKKNNKKKNKIPASTSTRSPLPFPACKEDSKTPRFR